MQNCNLKFGKSVYLRLLSEKQKNILLMYKFMGLLVFSLLMSCQSKAQTNTEQKKNLQNRKIRRRMEKDFIANGILCVA